MPNVKNTSQYTHKETVIHREFCDCRNQLTPHTPTRVCQWCGNDKRSPTDLSDAGVIRLDRKGQPIRGRQV